VDGARQGGAGERHGGEAEAVDPRGPLQQALALLGNQVHLGFHRDIAVPRTGGATRWRMGHKSRGTVVQEEHSGGSRGPRGDAGPRTSFGPRWTYRPQYAE